MSLKADISSVSPLSERLDNHSDEGLFLETPAYKLFTVANLNSSQWPIYIFNSVVKTKLPCYTLSLTQHHSFFSFPDYLQVPIYPCG